MVRSRSKPRQRKNSFAFAGLVSCTCGKRLTGQLARGRYRYYACSARCGAAPIKEAALSALFLEHVKAIHIDEKTAEWIVEAMREFEDERKREHDQRLAKIQEDARRIQADMDAEFQLKIKGEIDKEFWNRHFSSWQIQLAQRADETRTLQSATFDSIAKADALVKLCRKAPDLFARQTFAEQSQMIRLIELDSIYDGKTLKPLWKKPFDTLVEGLKQGTGGPGGTFKRTLLGGIRSEVNLPDLCALAA